MLEAYWRTPGGVVSMEPEKERANRTVNCNPTRGVSKGAVHGSVACLDLVMDLEIYFPGGQRQLQGLENQPEHRLEKVYGMFWSL